MQWHNLKHMLLHLFFVEKEVKCMISYVWCKRLVVAYICWLESARTYVENCNTLGCKKDCAEWFSMCNSSSSVLAWCTLNLVTPMSIILSNVLFVLLPQTLCKAFAVTQWRSCSSITLIDFQCELLKFIAFTSSGLWPVSDDMFCVGVKLQHHG